MRKTTYRFDWENGYTVCKRCSRSFATLEEANKFADEKPNSEVYISKGRYKVEWILIKSNDN